MFENIVNLRVESVFVEHICISKLKNLREIDLTSLQLDNLWIVKNLAFNFPASISKVIVLDSDGKELFFWPPIFTRGPSPCKSFDRIFK